ncbi:MAG TPA: hypothetical protein VM327_02515 [Candidatus Thermoplasmatota archaeon]|nr:hypothetical protein [Candidatus Thermoplasmatota archaeon]
MEWRMGPALLLTFDARGTLLGGVTAKRPEVVIRVWDTVGLRAASRSLVEIRGGKVDLEAWDPKKPILP